MSDEAYARAVARENRVWTPFVHSFPFDAAQTEERGLIFGLYSASIFNRHGYLIEVEASDLSNMLADYNTRMAELTMQEQVVVADIVSKRYLATIDKIIHDQKLATQTAKISAEDAEWTAKIAALAADQAALDTLVTRVATETEKTGARISEIQAYIAIEAVNLSETDIQIAEKAIQSAKVDIEKLDASNAVLKIQLDTVRAAQEVVNIDLQIARTRISISGTDLDIAKIGLLDSELAVEQAQTEAAGAEIPVAEARIVLAGEKSAGIDREITHQTTLTEQSETDTTNRIELMNLKETIREEEIDQRQEEKALDLENRRTDSDQSVVFVTEDRVEQQALDALKVRVMDAKVSNSHDLAVAEVRVAEIRAAAEVGTTLTHTIQKKKT